MLFIGYNQVNKIGWAGEARNIALPRVIFIVSQVGLVEDFPHICSGSL